MKLVSLAELVVRLIVSTRRSIPAWVLYLILLFAVYSSDPGAPGPAYATTASMLLPVTTWLAVTCAPREAGTTSLLAAAAGGPRRLHAVVSLATFAVVLPLILLAVVVGPLASAHRYGAHVLFAALLAHLSAALVGVGVGAVINRAILRDAALAAGAAVAVTILLLVVRWSSPLNPVLHTMSAAATDATSASISLSALLLGAAVSLVWCAVLTVVGGALATRTRGYGTAAADVRQ